MGRSSSSSEDEASAGVRAQGGFCAKPPRWRNYVLEAEDRRPPPAKEQSYSRTRSRPSPMVGLLDMASCTIIGRSMWSSSAHLSSRQSFSGQRARDKLPAEGGQSAADDASETSWLEETGETSAELLVEELQQHRQRADTASTRQPTSSSPRHHPHRQFQAVHCGGGSSRTRRWTSCLGRQDAQQTSLRHATGRMPNFQARLLEIWADRIRHILCNRSSCMQRNVPTSTVPNLCLTPL
ncbi:uncharacterized protein LOC144115013 [Amblyomma americanum]